jgi:D-tyrosyl-tRNA(Tyr) deacylase
MGGEEALEMFNQFVEVLRGMYDAEKVQVGAFGEYMEIDMECDGPVTMTIDTDE